MQKIIVLGAGMIGRAIAVDLSNKYDVASSDVQLCPLRELSEQHSITAEPCNFRDKESLKKLIEPFDLVIGAVPGHLGFEVLKTVIETGKNIVDISFFPEDAFLLDELARKNNVTAVVDCGVAPGMCNILFGHHHKQMKISKYECLVGGLPVIREFPYEYKAVFSPSDVIEIYTRTVHCIKNGKLIEKEALSDIEKIHFDEVGELESFNTDGLRSLTQTMKDVPNMIEKTLRYPGHAHLMKVFRETGLFSKIPMDINGAKVIPLEFISKLLFSKWRMEPEEEDFTVMRVTIEGPEGKYVYNLFDRFDKNTKTTSMARTTGYTCTAVANLILQGDFSRKGICFPEFIGEDENCFAFISKYLTERNVLYKTDMCFTKRNLSKKELSHNL